MYDGPEITEVKRLDIRPGDRLVLRVDRIPDMQEADDIRQYMARFAGPEVPVLVLGPGQDIEVIEPPEMTVSVDLTGGESLLKAMQEAVRHAGGDPGMFSRRAR